MPTPEIPSHTPFFVRLEPGKTYTWCACGRSQSQPFCDGSHTGGGIEPLEFTHEGQRNNYPVCGCKHTRQPPMCDGAHRELMVAADDRADAMEARFPSGVPVRDEHTAGCSFGACVPDLPVKDAPAAVRYYAEVLGFEKLFDDAIIGFDHVMYACMSRGAFRLTLDEHRANEVGKSVQLRCEVDDVEGLYAEFEARGATIVEPLTDRVWQARDFSVADLDGHMLSFSMNLKSPTE